MAYAIFDLPPGVHVSFSIAAYVAPTYDQPSGVEGRNITGMLERMLRDQSSMSKLGERHYEVQSTRNLVGMVAANLGPRIWNFDAAEVRIRAIAQQKGIAFDDILNAASANFTAPAILPDVGQMSEDELKRVVEHDDHSLEG